MADSLATSARDPHGRQAESPTEVPPRGWRDVATRTLAEMKQDRATLLSAGVAFFLFLALVPALVVVISVYGIVADPSDVRSFVRDSLGAAPREVRQLMSSQLQDLVRTTGGKAGLAAVIGTLIALWSASSGMGHLVEAINAAFDEHDDRKFVAKRSLALALTVAAFVFGAIAIALIVFLPTMLADAVDS